MDSMYVYSLTDRYLDCFHFGTIMNHGLKVHGQVFVWTSFAVTLGSYLVVGLLAHMGTFLF